MEESKYYFHKKLINWINNKQSNNHYYYYNYNKLYTFNEIKEMLYPNFSLYLKNNNKLYICLYSNENKLLFNTINTFILLDDAIEYIKKNYVIYKKIYCFEYNQQPKKIINLKI